MSLELCGNLNDELERYALLRRPGMTPQRVAELKPPFDINRFPTVLNAEDIASDGVPLGVVDAVSLAPSDELRLWMERLSRGALPTAPTATAPTATAPKPFVQGGAAAGGGRGRGGGGVFVCAAANAFPPPHQGAGE